MSNALWMSHRVIVVLVCIFMFAATDGFSETLYVDAANNTGNESGTMDNPFDTIPEAMNAALEDDTISVAPGIYYGAISLSKGIKLISQKGPQSTILDGLSGNVIDGYYVNSYHDYYINGFTLTGSGGLVSLIRTYQVVMENCIFRDNTYGLYLSSGSGFTARNCVFINISGIAVHSMFNGGPVFQNVTVDGSDIAFRAIYSTVRPYNVSISNVNTPFYINAPYWAQISGSNVNLWNYQQISPDPSKIYIANLSFNDPLYVAPPQNYRLQPGSPLIDAGINIGLPFVGTAPEIGAYEFTELTLPEKLENLATSFAGAPPEIFRNPAEQRKISLYKKFEAILKMIYLNESGVNNIDARLNVLNGCLGKLQNDILSKTDGNNGGNPSNDWIENDTEKSELYNQVLTVINDIKIELDANP